VLVFIADDPSHDSTRFQRPVELPHDLLHLFIENAASSGKFPQTLRSIGIPYIVGVGRVDDVKVYGIVAERHATCVVAQDIGPPGRNVETQRASPQSLRNVDRRATTGHAVHGHIPGTSEASHKVVDAQGGGYTAEIPVSKLAA